MQQQVKNIVQDDIRIINEHQKLMYENEEKRHAKNLIKSFSIVLETLSSRKVLKILDIGGASGYFALALHEYFKSKNCEVEIIVLDPVRYDTWVTFADKITFLEQSTIHLKELFAENTFDIIFANRVFHHFVKNSWRTSVNGMYEIMKQIAVIIRKDGYFCISEHFFDGLFYDKASSKIVYALSSSTFQPIITICKKVGVESAGVGVCFLSKKMWLKLLSETGFTVENVIEYNWPKVKQWYKKIFFLNKSNTLGNIIISKLYST